MPSPQEAEQIVRRLTRKYGFLNEKMMNDIEQFNSEYRREIDENWLAMESAVSHSVKILAKQIYGSGARFVFELLQNAEDNSFKKAGENKALPFISFKMHPDRIVVDCNEDGFTENDLQAICAVGQSTKSASHGYIGAKGIGFKSVFIAASRVHIQSGNFSFKFQHNKTDPGIGMVRPIWFQPAETIPDPLTRMTLYLHDQGDPGELKHLKKIITMQFDDLQETCLLFLRKLQQITLEFYDENGTLERSKQFRKYKIDKHRVSLETTSIINGKESTQTQIYHITKERAFGLSRSDNREPPDTDEARRLSAIAEVVLAFPLTSSSEPLITQKKQDLFAFLPLRKSDYKFLIHSDFDTNANRQDIVTTSRRNLDLLDWIASAFLKAVLEFCEHPTLCYHWPMFLPPPDNSSDPFWSGLDEEICRLIKNMPILRSRSRTSLRLISDVVVLATTAMDKDGQPVLDDSIKDLYLSPNYPQKVVDILRNYGLDYVSLNTLVNLLETDIRSDNSKMYGKDTTNDWHSVVAQILCQCLRVFFSSLRPKLNSLHLIPLRNGEWTSIASGPVYFSATSDVDVPTGLDLRILDPSASINPDRKTLFEQMGVSEPEIRQVRASIFRYFDDSYSTRMLNDVKASIAYLYLTHQPHTHTKENYAKVKTICDPWMLKCPQASDVYLPGTARSYSPESLLAAEGTAPGLPVDFVHSTQMDHVPERPTPSHPSWERWLCDSIGVRERLRLLSRNGDTLSEAFLYVFEHRPDKFLGLFEHLWLHEKSYLKRNPTLRSKIEDLSAKELCKVDFPVRLKQTWLPLKPLQNSVARYMEHPDQFPFLKLEESDTIQHGTKWDFLSEYFSVGKDVSLDFLLEILSNITRSCPSPSSVRQTQMVFDLYVAIYFELAMKNDEPARRKTREFFTKGVILVPDEAPRWTGSATSLWAAPPNMETSNSLKTLYSRVLGDEQLGNIENLFQRTLEIPNATLDDLVTELTVLESRDCKDIDRTRALYKYLDEFVTSLSDMKAKFEASRLIYCETRHGDSGWYKLSDCLWSSETPIRGKVILDWCWENEKSFFLDKLGVKLLTLQMVYDDLRQSPRTSVDDIKVAILTFNNLLQTENIYLDPEPIRKATIFPVRYPNETIVLSSMDVDFAIGDRDKLKTLFQPKLSLLYFDLEDTNRLKPFFKWVGLEDRYLSKTVREITSISGDSGRLISSRNRNLKCKAYSITRVAATFNSPRFEQDPSKLYEQLRTMTVMEIDGISSVLEVLQNGNKRTVKVATASEHIDETSERLTVYVPKSRKAQELCFGSVLPRKLAAWLMRDPTTQIDGTVEVDAVKALTSIFAYGQSALNEILDDQGILKLSFDNQDENNEEEDEDEDEEQQEQQPAHSSFETDDASSGQQMTPTHSSLNEGSLPHTGLYDANLEGSFPQTVVEAISRQSRMSRQPNGSSPPDLLYHSSPPPNISRYEPSQRFPAETQTSGHGDYLEVLRRVVAAARRAALPSRGAFDMSDMRDALPGDSNSYESFDGLDVLSRARSHNQLERDKKVGAAGELYVFELLSKLEMPGWGRANWQSTIRTYVTIHPDYVNMEELYIRETADLVYADIEGHFTNSLIGCGYLDQDEWHGARPKYYIEVKTTTGPCHTPFYMSGKQYGLMRRIHYAEDRSEIYLIFRVFWLNSNRIGLRIYSDPEQLRQDGQLVFTGQTWSIIPGEPGQSR